MNAIQRNNVKVSGNQDGTPMVFAHGFGCDQNMWRLVAPKFEDRFKVVLFDYVGFGETNPDDFDVDRYSALEGYATDVVEICRELGLADVVFVGHSVSAMIGVLAFRQDPELFSKLVMVGPSPRYINDNDSGYVGGFEKADIEELMESLESNYLGWSAAMAPAIMGNGDRPELGSELTASFCRTDPGVAKTFARATFFSDNRADLPNVKIPSLVLQCQDDVIAPVSVGEFVTNQLPEGKLVLLDATGHCPNLSAPEETTAAIEQFVGSDRRG